MQYDTLHEDLFRAVPELRALLANLPGASDELPGQYIIFEDLFRCWINLLLQENESERRQTLLRQAFAFVEDLVASEDEKVNNLGCLAMLSGQPPWWWHRAAPFLGVHSKAYLDEQYPEWRTAAQLIPDQPEIDPYMVGEAMIKALREP